MKQKYELKRDYTPTFPVVTLTRAGRGALGRLIKKHPDMFIQGATADNAGRNGDAWFRKLSQ